MGGLDEAVDLDIDISPMQRRRKDPKHRSNAPDSGELVRPTLVGGDGFLRYHPGVQTNSAAKVIIVRTVVSQLGKKSPRTYVVTTSC